MKNILWLTSWFPEIQNPLSGDFIERHARSASLLNRISILFVVKDHQRNISGKKLIERKQYSSNLTSIILYYKPFGRIGFIEKFISGLQYFLFLKKLINEYIAQNGKPDLVNVHISYKAGIGALYCKWKYGIRYVVSEQWTIFCPEARPGFRDQSFIARWFIRLIYKNAAHCSTVSWYLGKSLSEKFNIRPPVRIPNVVDTKLFHPSSGHNEIFRFIHISLLNYQKSPDEIFEAVRLLKQKTTKAFEFVIYSPLIPALVDLARKYGLLDTVHFKGEVKHDKLSIELRNCDALVLYSRFETFGCVVIEAYASGVPVIVSDIPVMREIVEENITGVFVSLEEPEMLAEKMLWMMNNRSMFNSSLLAAHAEEKYAFEKVSKQFENFYNNVYSKNN